ncbi:hypothetical protein VTJ49DRAFT_1475 [Mycothermus thermophilus]|uniref:Uncharacterized protein n=1 Tax=Humicola insolens TaxID=85995 RepID=A0ABR3VCK0_HUMIN
MKFIPAIVLSLFSVPAVLAQGESCYYWDGAKYGAKRQRSLRKPVGLHWRPGLLGQLEVFLGCALRLIGAGLLAVVLKQTVALALAMSDAVTAGRIYKIGGL